MKKIKDLIRRFGILVIRAIWPGKGERNAQKLGVVMLGLCALLGVTKASSVQKLFFGSAQVAAGTTLKAAPATAPAPATTAVTAAETADTESAPASAAPNIVELINDSELIISGMVTDVTDGFENGLPYTEVTVEVSEALRGQVGEEYKFRQFGLKEPRKMENGKIYLGTTPEGWSKYAVGENTMLFLHKAASVTGLRTTAGLGQGKVVFQGGNAVSQAGNDGLFENVEVDAKLLNDKDKRLLATKKGAVNADGFKSFVKRAVNEKWIEGGKMRHVKK